MTPRPRLTASSLVVRGAVAEALYEVEFAQPQTAATPPATVPPVFNATAATGPSAATAGPTFVLAECSAARRPDLVRAYLATEAGTEAEMAALTEVNRNAFGACLVPGSQLSVNRFGIRAMLAEGLYRWSLAQRGSPMPAAVPAPAPAPRRRN